MLACYGWTNTHLFNIANAKVSHYADQQADLYVYSDPQVSLELVQAIRSSDIFENVYYIEPAKIDCKFLKWGFIPKLRLLFLKKAYLNFYKRILINSCGEKVYERAFIPIFNNTALCLLNYWSHNNPHLKISFVEEGCGSYCIENKDLFFPPNPTGKFKESIRKWICDYALARKFSKLVDSIYIYEPGYCTEIKKIQKLKLPAISEANNPVLSQILVNAAQALELPHLIRYEKRRVYYFTTYNLSNTSKFDKKSLEVLEAIFEVSNNNRVAVKVHSNSIAHAKKFACAIEPSNFVDRHKYHFESLYYTLPDNENKVLISVASTLMLSPKYLFGKEPYLIFTYRLYDEYRQKKVTRDDKISDDIKDAYINKNRVMIPNSIQELKEMLAETLYYIDHPDATNGEFDGNYYLHSDYEFYDDTYSDYDGKSDSSSDRSDSIGNDSGS